MCYSLIYYWYTLRELNLYVQCYMAAPSSAEGWRAEGFGRAEVIGGDEGILSICHSFILSFCHSLIPLLVLYGRSRQVHAGGGDE